MRIIHVIGSINRKHGGPGEVVCNLSLGQVNLGFNVSIFTNNSGNNILNEIEHDIDVCEIGDGFLYNRFNEIIKNYNDEKIIFYIHGLWEKIIFITVSYALINKIPYVIAPHGMLNPWSLGHKKIKKYLALNLFAKYYIQNAIYIHALNKNEQKHIQRLFEKIICNIIPNGVDINYFNKFKSDKFNHNDIELYPFLKRKYILYLSRIHYVKGLDFLIKSFDSICDIYPDVELVIAGNDDGFKKNVVHLINECKNYKKIHIFGPVYNYEKYIFIKNAHIFCLPSRQEGFSVAILEALSLGVPVVISSECNFSEVQANNVGFEFNLNHKDEKETINNLSFSISSALELSSKQYLFYSQGAEKLIKLDYSWKEIANKTLFYINKYAV